MTKLYKLLIILLTISVFSCSFDNAKIKNNPDEYLNDPVYNTTFKKILIVYITSEENGQEVKPASVLESTIEHLIGSENNNKPNVDKLFQMSTYGKIGLKLEGVEEVKVQISTNGIHPGFAAGAAEQILINNFGYQFITVNGETKFQRPGTHADGPMIFDYVMCFVPRNTQMFMGYGSGYKAVFGGSYVNLLAHELAHCLGLGHSGIPTSVYGDHTCIVGGSTPNYPRLFNAPSRLELGIFNHFPGSLKKFVSDSDFKIYPLGEKPRKLEDGNFQLKVVEIDLGQVFNAIQNRNEDVRYTVSFIKIYDINSHPNPNQELTDLFDIWTDNIDREVLIHKQYKYTFTQPNGNPDVFKQNIRLANLDLQNNVYTINEYGFTYEIKLKQLSSDSSFGEDFAIVEVLDKN